MKSAIPYGILIFVLLGLPLTGVWLSDRDMAAYLEFPPRTQYVEHAPFSWPVFIGLAASILIVTLLFLIKVGIARSPSEPSVPGQTDERPARQTRPARHFPWWGHLACGLGLVFWILAWTRFSWFKPLQLYTFSPLWFCYIIVVNALTHRRIGRCMMTHQTAFFIKLFFFSAAFWWFFEYLNRFVQNWHYVECEQFSPLQYFISATLPFSTVLPAVLSTEEWLAAHPRCHAGLEQFVPLKIGRSKGAGLVLLTAAAAGLLLIGVFPNQLYPLLWLAPLLLLVAFQRLSGRPPFFPGLESGDWRRVFRFALAALICGFFWEMWNLHSLAKWIYTVPYVHRFQLFEMPILGYSGYLPFGLECAVVGDLIRRSQDYKIEIR